MKNPTVQRDPRDPRRFEWIEQAREVKPIVLEPPHDISSQSNLRSRENLAGLEAYEGPWEALQARHLLSRALFGVRKSELEASLNAGLKATLDELLSELTLPEPPVNDYEGLEDGAEDPHVGFGESWLNAPHGGQKESYRIVSLKNWMIKNILEETPNLRQKMVLLWSTLLPTKIWDVFIAKASYKYLEKLHKHALGSYRQLIKDITLDPAMLIFLNNFVNTKEAPDENFARELQELFTVGKGPDAQYTEGDVQAAARVMTGWSITWDKRENEGPFEARFNAWAHDTSNKQFSEFYDNRLIEGNGGQAGRLEVYELLDMIMANRETARYIVRRIYSFFVSNEINDATEEQIIRPLAQLFRESDYAIAPVMRKLLGSAHFYEQANRGVLIKSPADHLLGIWRTLEVEQRGIGLHEQYRIHRSMLWHMANQGMEMGDPPNVAGWAAYYQKPQYDKAWITTDTITRRAGGTDSLLYWGFWISPEIRIKVDIVKFVAGLNNPADPNDLLEEAAHLLLGLELSESVRDQLKSTLLSGQLQDYYWTDAWYDYQSYPLPEGNPYQIVHTRLQSAFRQLLQLGEYHLM
ncbi:MAG TPA: DUF1800 family protein [Saprospiraceae bacterium]|nr:DUF1800 family protein [Saprospiraceae bacterium]